MLKSIPGPVTVVFPRNDLDVQPAEELVEQMGEYLRMSYEASTCVTSHTSCNEVAFSRSEP